MKIQLDENATGIAILIIISALLCFVILQIRACERDAINAVYCNQKESVD